MKIFSKRKMLFKLIVALCIFLTLVSVGMPSEVQAGWIFNTAKGAAEQGGKLLAPIVDLVLALGDAVIDILQQAIMGTESYISLDIVGQTIIGIITAALAIAIVVFVVIVAGPLVAALAPILSTIVAGGIGLLTLTVGGSLVSGAYTGMSSAFLPDITLFPTYTISPEEIFKGQILLFDVNIFNPKELWVKVYDKDDENIKVDKKVSQWNATNDAGEYTDNERKAGYEVEYYFYYKDGDSTNKRDSNIIATSANNSAAELKNVVAKWYYSIRNIAIVALMLILLYVGIRMLISSTASEKSKYKQMLGDWLVAMCLLFVMQYIMVFANNITENITLLLSSFADEGKHIVVIKDIDNQLRDGLEEVGLKDSISGNDVVWPTNLMGKARLLAQQHDGTTGYVGYALCYLVLVIYTVIFTLTYAKRLLYIIFFTIISPFVAVTYPLDKISDGKAQAFNIWLKEYIFNLLIQPFHLLLYTVLISTAFDLAGTNIIYSLVAIGFMTPAEKFLRKMFGFDKASTPGFLEGAAGAAVAMHGLHSLQKIAGKGPGAKGKVGNGKGEQDPGKIDFMDRGADSDLKTDKMLEGLGSGDDEGNMFTPKDNEKQTQEPSSAETDAKALAHYESEGYGKNADGEYFNPYTDEYDPAYDPTKDSKYTGIQPKSETESKAKRTAKPSDSKPKSPGKKIEPRKSYANARFTNFRRAIKPDFSLDNVLKTSENVFRTGAGLAMGAAGGIIGTAAGIASGDLKSVSQNMIGGAYAGSAIGTGFANAEIAKIEDSRVAHQEAIKEMYGDNYSAYIKERKDKMFQKDGDMRKLYSREFADQIKDGVKLDDIMLGATEYRKRGITDNGTIIKAMRGGGGNPSNWTDPERIAAAKLAGVSKSEKDLQATMKRFAKTPGIKPEQVSAMEKRIRQINDL